MATMEQAGSSALHTGGTPDAAPAHVSGYLARQPILDRRGTVFGYELHFHQQLQPPVETMLSPASHGLLDALAIFGVERFTSGSRGFLNCSLETLVEGALEGLPPSHTVLEITSPSEPFPKLNRTCRNLQNAGFQLALIDFDAGRSADELLEMVDYVKVDAKSLEGPDWDRACKALASTHATVVADKIHTHDSYRKARALGIKYFLVMGDASVVYRLLRFVNSPLCAVREPVSSVESAIMILGDNLFRRIATLAIQCGLSQDEPPELLNMALVRARFCSEAASLVGLDPDEQYLLGMLSLLPPMLRVPMQTIVPQLPLRPAVRNALGGTACKERALLSWVEDLEENRISGCEQIAANYNLDRTGLAEIYCHALEDTNNIALLD